MLLPSSQDLLVSNRVKCFDVYVVLELSCDLHSSRPC